MLTLLLCLSFSPTEPAIDWDHGVIETDAREFGSSWGEAAANAQLARRHREFMEDEMAWAPWRDDWRANMYWREFCWEYLADALDPSASPGRRVWKLSCLKMNLADGIYERRLMPAPIPSYRH